MKNLNRDWTSSKNYHKFWFSRFFAVPQKIDEGHYNLYKTYFWGTIKKWEK